MSFFPAKKIPPYALWVGSVQDSRNVGAAKRHGITLVVNCTRNVPFSIPGVQRVRVAVDDDPTDAEDMALHLPRAVAAIEDHLARGGAVLVHCHAGISRSASVAAAYVMYKEGLGPRQAMARVRAAKPETFGPHPNFATALEAFGRITSRTPGTPASTRPGSAA